MFGWLLNTPLVKVVRTKIWNWSTFKIKEIESLPTNKQTNKKIIGKFWINYHSSQIIQEIFWNLLFFAFSHRGFCIFRTLHSKRWLSSCSNSEITISVPPWSSFLVFKEILRRSSQQRYSVKWGVLKNFANLSGKHLCWSLFLRKFVKKRDQYRYFPVKFAKSLKVH